MTQFGLIKQSGDNLSRLQARMASISAMQIAVSGLIANLCMLAFLALVIPKVSSGQLTGVLLGVIALVALMSFEAVQPLPLAAQNLATNRAATHRLYELVDASPAVSDPADPLELPKKANIDVQNISFQYPEWVDNDHQSQPSQFTLKDISFSLPQGKHIAIVGPSGAGKTTLINILQRFWEYQNGSIRWGGNEIRSYLPQEIRKHTGIISQNTYLFSATIRRTCSSHNLKHRMSR
jgi:ATP-binding cassette subfamily C protein CydC